MAMFGQAGPVDQPAWDEVAAAIAAAPYPIRVLPADAARARACQAALGITAQSWLGAIVTNTGGLLVDHGWLRVLGSGHNGLPDVTREADPAAHRVVVGYDVMGGQFAWLAGQPIR